MSGLSYHPPMLNLLFCPPMPCLLSFLMPSLLTPSMPALTSHSILGLTLTYFISLALKIFKQSLFDMFLGHKSTSTSPTELLYLFSTLVLLSKKSNHKRFFDTVFINSCQLAKNNTAKEIDLSFGEYGYLVLVKLNRL